MATSGSYFQTKWTQNCPICLGDFKIPRQLPCMHSYCEKCLQDYLSSQEENVKKLKQIKCPICRQDVRISEQGISGRSLASLFPINVILQSFVSDTKEKVDHPCDCCHSASISRSAQGFCVQCEEAMCEHCSEVHQKQKISRNHVIISLKEFTGNPHNVMMLAKGFSCPEHDGEAIEFYCKDHRTVCCGKCCIISHRSCFQVSDLKKELPSLLREKKPENIIDQMKILETRLNKFKEINETNISLLESQVKGLTSQIRELRKKLNDALDDLEKRVKKEGNRICKEEMIENQEVNHRSQSLINSIRNSYTLLETVKMYGTETQVFVMTEKMASQLTSYLNQIQKMCTKTETTTVLLEVNPHLQSILSAGPDSLAKIINRRELQSLPVPDIETPPRDCLFQNDKIIEVKDDRNFSLPDFTGVTYLYSGHVMLADFKNEIVILLDSSYNSIASYKLPGKPYDICVVDDNDIVAAVTLPFQNAVQLLSVRNGKITPSGKITTRYICYGIAAAGKGKIVISGFCNDRGGHYWTIISSGGKEEFSHQFDCHCRPTSTYVTLDSSFTCIYVTVTAAHSLYCFDVRGNQKFVYSHDQLKSPRGITADSYDNMYVVGMGSRNIYQITSDGVVLQIISDELPNEPKAICFSRDGNKFLVTSISERKLYQYRIKQAAHHYQSLS